MTLNSSVANAINVVMRRGEKDDQVQSMRDDVCNGIGWSVFYFPPLRVMLTMPGRGGVGRVRKRLPQRQAGSRGLAEVSSLFSSFVQGTKRSRVKGPGRESTTPLLGCSPLPTWPCLYHTLGLGILCVSALHCLYITPSSRSRG